MRNTTGRSSISRGIGRTRRTRNGNLGTEYGDNEFRRNEEEVNITSRALIAEFCDRIAEMSGYWDQSYNVGRRSIDFPSGSRRARVAAILAESAIPEEERMPKRSHKAKTWPEKGRMTDGKWIKVDMVGRRIVKMEPWDGKIK